MASSQPKGKPPLPPGTKPKPAPRRAPKPSHNQSTEEELDSDSEQRLPMMPQQQPHFQADPNSQVQGSVGGGNGQSFGGDIEKLSRTASQLNNTKMGEVEEQPSPTGMIGWIGYGLAVFSLACLGISFTSPYWFQTYPGSFNTFRNMGLWEVCFDNYMHHKDDSQEIYSECWWVFNTDERYWKLREWLLPPWFISVQVMMTSCILIEIGCIIACSAIFLHFCPIMNHEYHQTYAMFACASLQFLATMICTIGVTVYGAMCGDRQWMPRPDLNFLSWGYGFAIIYGIFALASGVCLFLEARKAFDELMRRDDEYTQAVLDMTSATYPQSYGAPSYAPSYGAPSYGVPEYPSDSYPSDRKPSYATQPSFGGVSQQGYSDYGGGLPAKA